MTTIKMTKTMFGALQGALIGHEILRTMGWGWLTPEDERAFRMADDALRDFARLLRLEERHARAVEAAEAARAEADAAEAEILAACAVLIAEENATVEAEWAREDAEADERRRTRAEAANLKQLAQDQHAAVNP